MFTIIILGHTDIFWNTQYKHNALQYTSICARWHSCNATLTGIKCWRNWCMSGWRWCHTFTIYCNDALISRCSYFIMNHIYGRENASAYLNVTVFFGDKCWTLWLSLPEMGSCHDDAAKDVRNISVLFCNCHLNKLGAFLLLKSYLLYQYTVLRIVCRCFLMWS